MSDIIHNLLMFAGVFLIGTIYISLRRRPGE